MSISLNTAPCLKNSLLKTLCFCSQNALALFFIALAGYFCLTTLIALNQYGIRVLYADQWRIFSDYSNNPFPANVFALQNGHRPVISGLFFLLDRYLFGARQNFLLFTGSLLALATSTIIVRPFWRDRSLSLLEKSLAIYIAFTTIFWLGNSRVLFHGNESVHAYLVTFFFLLAAHALTKCPPSRHNGKSLAADDLCWITFACLLSQLAVFSFGAGVAAPPALAVIGFLLQLTRRNKVILLANTLVLGVLYLTMPSAPKVAGVLVSSGNGLQQGISNFLTILGAPLVFLIGGPGALYIPEAELFKKSICPLLGAIGATVLVARIISILRNKSDKNQIITVGLPLFTVMVVGLIAVMRSHYFSIHPGQLFANRYLVWTTLFWGGLSIDCFYASRRTNYNATRTIIFGITVLISLITATIIKTNNQQWLEHVERWQDITNTAATGLLIDVRDQKGVEQDLMDSSETIFNLTDKLRKEKLNIFSKPFVESINSGLVLSFPQEFRNKFPAMVTIDRTFSDPTSKAFSARVTISFNHLTSPRTTYILLTNQTDHVVGMIVRQNHRVISEEPDKVLYTGYVKEYAPNAEYHLFGITDQKHNMVPMTTIHSP